MAHRSTGQDRHDRDATIIASHSEHDDETWWVRHKGRKAVHGRRVSILPPGRKHHGQFTAGVRLKKNSQAYPESHTRAQVS